MADAPGVEIKGLDDFRRELKKLEGNFPKELRDAHRDIAKHVEREARKFAVGTGRMQAHFASQIRGRADNFGAWIGLRSSQANAAFFGAERKTGWYAAPRYFDSPPQFPDWVGNNWDVGVLGQGPYAINPAIFHELPEIERRYGEVIDDISRRAFPD